MRLGRVISGGSILTITPGDIATGAEGGSPGADVETESVPAEGGVCGVPGVSGAVLVLPDCAAESGSVAGKRVSASVLSVPCTDADAGVPLPSPQPLSTLAHMNAAYSEICIFIVVPCFILCGHDGELTSQFYETVRLVLRCLDGVLMIDFRVFRMRSRALAFIGRHLALIRQSGDLDIHPTDV
jgi:hypothetical protein